jgi:hypothetical protein
MMAVAQNTFSSAKALASIERIRAHMLEHETITGPQVMQLLGISQSNASSYLRHMEGLGMIRCSVPSVLRKFGSKPAVWAVQCGPARDCEERRVIVRTSWEPNHARMPLDCLLFGEPARAPT